MSKQPKRKPLTPLPPRPPIKRTLTDADLAAIREVVREEVNELAALLRSMR